MKFYTNVFQVKNAIHHYYIEDGKRKKETQHFRPSLGVPSKKATFFKDIFGNHVIEKPFGSIWEMNQWRKENSEYMSIYGDVPATYQFIAEQYPTTLDLDFTSFQYLKVFNIDIEVYSNQGFPYPEAAKHPVTAITIQDMYQDKYYVFGTQDYKVKSKNVTYQKCVNEVALLDAFVEFFHNNRPDILTGWNIEGFDVPYLVNRAKNILPKGRYMDLSPTRTVTVSTFEKFNKNTRSNTIHNEYRIQGIQILDFIKLYRKFCLEPRESYALDAISEIELGENKVDYHGEYASLSDLYDRNYDLFIDYNIKDVELVSSLNNKRHYIELLMTMAYMAKVNYEDAFGSVKIWDIFIYNVLKQNNMMTSPKKKSFKEAFPGGYVKEPEPGLKEWLIVADITSSYPNQIISFNISPETLVDESMLPIELYDLKHKLTQIDGYVDLEKMKEHEGLLKKNNVTLAANGEFFTKEKYGIFPTMVAGVFNQRKTLKKKAQSLYNEIQTLKDELRQMEKNQE